MKNRSIASLPSSFTVPADYQDLHTPGAALLSVDDLSTWQGAQALLPLVASPVLWLSLASGPGRKVPMLHEMMLGVFAQEGMPYLHIRIAGADGILDTLLDLARDDVWQAIEAWRRCSKMPFMVHDTVSGDVLFGACEFRALKEMEAGRRELLQGPRTADERAAVLLDVASMESNSGDAKLAKARGGCYAAYVLGVPPQADAVVPEETTLAHPGHGQTSSLH